MRTPACFVTTALVAAAIVPCLATESIHARPAPTEARVTDSSPGTRERDATSRVRDAYAATPMRFEALEGRGGIDADFLARGSGYVVALGRDGATLLMNEATDRRRVSIALRLMGASPLATGRGRHMLPGVTNYLIGNEPRQWRTGLRSFAEVEYRDVYPGVDLVYYGNQRQLEYDFIVAPGADYRAIGLAFSGSTQVSIDRQGNLVLATEAGNLVQRAPTIYQINAGTRRSVRGGYVLQPGGRVGFEVEDYDSRLPLIIDPVLTYSSYLGGVREERAAGVAVDAQGNMYLAGLTGATDFPISAPPGLAHGRDNWDAFVVKLTANGDQFAYATYLGGGGYDEPASLAVDADGSAYVVGVTESFDFPTLNGMQSTRRGFDDGFVTKLDGNGSIVYSTYLGGSAGDRSTGVAVDALGRAYVTGSTSSGDFPTVNAAQRWLSGSPAFRTIDGRTWAGISNGLNTSHVTMFAIDPVDPAIVYGGTDADGVFVSFDGGSTWSPTSASLPPGRVNGMVVDAGGAVYIASAAGVFRSADRGASWTDLHFFAGAWTIAVDPSGVIYVAFSTGEWPTLGLFKSTNGGTTWGLAGLPIGVMSLAVSQSVVYAGTVQGLFKSDNGSTWTPVTIDPRQPGPIITALSVDPGNPDLVYAGTPVGLFVSISGGATWSPVNVFAGAYVMNVAIAPSDPDIVYAATSFGGGRTEDGGVTWRGAPPVGVNVPFFAVDPLDPTRAYAAGGVGLDVFVSRVSPDGSTLQYSTFLGGIGSESDSDIAVDETGAAYVAGTTQLGGFPVRNAFQANPGGFMDMDVFAAKFSAAGAVVYATYLGGFGSDSSSKIAVDSAGRAHIVGLTLSTNFPTANAYQPVHGGGFSDVFVTTLNQAGNGLVFSTFLGGSDQESDSTGSRGPDVALGPFGETFVTGTTRSTNFPRREAIQTTYGGGATDAFVAAFDHAGQLQSSTYLGGSGQDAGRRVAFDLTGALVVAGSTNSTNFPTHDPLQAQNAGDADVFVARISVDTPPPPEDTIAPTTAVGVSGTLGSSGWYRSSVLVTLTATDDQGGSGVSYVEYSLNSGPFQLYSMPFSIDAQGTTIVHPRATDTAGNTESPGATAAVSIDSAPPVISVSSPTSSDYLHSAALLLSFGATDATSGIDGSPTARLDGTSVTSGATAQLLAMTLGSHTLEVTSSDRAGNTATKTVSFRVIATIDSLIAAVNTFAAQGAIGSNTASSLISKLEDARQALNRGNTAAARAKLGDFSDQVAAQQGKSIDASAAQVLLDDAAFVHAGI